MNTDILSLRFGQETSRIFFPQYSSLQYESTSNKQQGARAVGGVGGGEEKEDQFIERMNKAHKKIRGGNLMVPMLRLNLISQKVQIWIMLLKP
jgi:hypothetical protein